jgi:hypothetical protein
MRLDTEFFRLPYTFDAARLAEEAAALGEAALLVDAAGGTAQATPLLARCPTVREVLASLRAPIGHTRLLRIGGPADPAPRIDWSHYSLNHAHVHVPIVTAPAVIVRCGSEAVHMNAGEAWAFDTSRPHAIVNPSGSPAVHLVADVYPTRPLWDGADDELPPLRFDTYAAPAVMSPAEQEELVSLLDPVPAAVRWFLHDWRELWHQYGRSPQGRPQYRALRDLFDAALEGLPERDAVRELLVVPALGAAPGAPAVLRQRRLDRPVFIVSSPRAGSTLLFQTLLQSPSVFISGGESHELIEGIAGLHPADRGWESNRLTEADATPRVAAEIEDRFVAQLYDRDGGRTLPARVRMLEKTTKNLLRIPFLRALYPDARFICLHRDPLATISSLLDIWRAQTMVSYPELPGWEGPPWTLTLVPRWRETNAKPLEEIVAHQWSEGMRVLLDDVEQLDPLSWCAVSYEALVAEPQKEIDRLCAFAGLAWDTPLTAPLPLSVSTLTDPSPEKWLRNREALERIADRIEPVAARARGLLRVGLA